jgi:hypothetical protein
MFVDLALTSTWRGADPFGFRNDQRLVVQACDYHCRFQTVRISQ